MDGFGHSETHKELKDEGEEQPMSPTDHAEAESIGSTSESSDHNSPKRFTLRELADATGNVLPESFMDRINDYISNQLFFFDELHYATKGFSNDFLLGNPYGVVYAGILMKMDKFVAVKRMNKIWKPWEEDFMVELLMLSLLRHPNVINLIGYCAECDERILVYEFMPLGSLEDHLDGHKEIIDDWNTKMKIAVGAARGLEYLHHKTYPPVFHRDLKSAHILLDEGYLPKLSGFGIAKFGRVRSGSHIREEEEEEEEEMRKCDIYKFGVILLELITGLSAIQFRLREERSLVEWAYPMLAYGGKYTELVEWQLQQNYPMHGLFVALDLAYDCIQAEVARRPPISDVVRILSNICNILS